MEDRILGQLYYYHIDMLQERWLLWKADLYSKYWESSITMGMYLLDRQTWHMTITNTTKINFTMTYLTEMAQYQFEIRLNQE